MDVDRAALFVGVTSGSPSLWGIWVNVNKLKCVSTYIEPSLLTTLQHVSDVFISGGFRILSVAQSGLKILIKVCRETHSHSSFNVNVSSSSIGLHSWIYSRDFCLFSNIMELNNSWLVILKAPTKHIRGTHQQYLLPEQHFHNAKQVNNSLGVFGSYSGLVLTLFLNKSLS